MLPLAYNLGGNMKRLLYVDFENVSSAGLNGVLKLTKNDEVKIFLGPKCSKMSLIEAESILHCDATVELIKNDQIGKNALDFIIMVHLGYDIAKNAADRFFIISNDKGYEPAIHEMQSKTGEIVERYADIEQVIARKEEKTGFFACLFGKKKPVVENTTEHEVLNKRSRGSRNVPQNGQSNVRSSYGSNGNRSHNNNGNRSEHRNPRDNRNENRSEGRNDNRRNNPHDNRNNRKQNHAPREEKELLKKQNETAAEITKATPDTVRMSVQKPPKKQPVRVVNESNDDSYLDNLSIADLRAQLIPASGSTEVERSKAEQKQPKPAKKNGRRPRAELTDSEKDLVSRALKDTSNLGDFHNYILKELHDNDRATEIYKSEKHRVQKKPLEQPQAGGDPEVKSTSEE